MAKVKKKGHIHLDLDGNDISISVEGDNIYLAAALATVMGDKDGKDINDIITLAVASFMSVNKEKPKSLSK